MANRCFEEIRKIAPKEISDEVISSFIEDMRKLKDNNTEGLAAFRKKAMERVREVQLHLEEQQRAKADSLLKDQERRVTHQEAIARGRPEEGPLALLDGTNINLYRGRASVKKMQMGLYSKFRNALFLDLEDKGLAKAFFEKGLWQKEVYQELHAIQNNLDRGKSGSIEAQEIAESINSAFQMVFREREAAGFSVKERENWTAPRYHDAEKVLKAGFENWMTSIVEKRLFDLDTTFKKIGITDKAKQRAFMQDIFFSIVRMGEEAEPLSDKLFRIRDARTDFNKIRTRSRVLESAGPEAEFAYAQEFGKSLPETLDRHFQRASKDVAMVNTFGMSPRAALENDIRSIKSELRSDPEKYKRFQDREAQIWELFDTLKGGGEPVSRNMIAKFGSASRSALSWTKLKGTGAASFILDPVHRATLFSSTTGRDLGSSFLEATTESVKHLSESAQKEVFKKLAIFSEDLIGETVNRFDTGEWAPGAISKANRMYYKYIGLDRSTNAGKTSVAKMYSTELARYAEDGFSNLPERLQTTLKSYGISDAEWEFVRRGTQAFQDGRIGIIPESVEAIPAQEWGEYARSKGITIPRAKQNLSLSLMSLYNDVANLATLTPSSRNRVFFVGDSKENAFWGQIRRYAYQFHGASLSMFDIMQRISTSGMSEAPGAIAAIKAGRGSVEQLAATIVGLTVAGYLTEQLFELAAGRTPKSLKDPETAMRAFMRGGAGMLYMDFLAGDYEKSNRSLLSNFLGPVPSTINEIVESSYKAKSELERTGTISKSTKMTGVRTLRGLNPFNHFMLNGAFDRLIFDKWMESINPGYKDKLRQRIENTPGLLDDHQRYWWKQ